MTVRKGTKLGSVVLLEATGEPAFATDNDGHVIAWNAELKRLLGFSAETVMGKPCWEAVNGRDVFGNPYCHQFCGVRQAIMRNEPVRRFELRIRKTSGDVVRVVCSTLLVRGEQPSEPIMVHSLQPVMAVRGDAKDRNEQVLEASCEECPMMTERQVQILQYLAEGWTNRAVAEALGIKVATVRAHAHNILRKFSVHNVRQAIARARRCGLI